MKHNPEGYENLLKSVIQGNVYSVTQTAHEALGLPISVISVSLKTMCFFPEEKIGDPIFDALAENIDMNSQIFRQFRKAGVFTVQQSGEMVLIDSWQDMQASPVLVVGFGIKNDLIGYILVMLQDTDPDQVDMDIVRLLSEALSVVVLKSSKYNLSRNAEKLHMMRMLLSNSIKTPEELEDLNEVIGFPCDSGYMLVVATPTLCSNNNLSIMRRMSKTICSNHQYVISYVFDKQTFFLFGNIEDTECQGFAEAKKIVEYLNKNNISCGMSSIYHDILDTASMKKQAEIALEVGKKVAPYNYAHTFSDNIVYCIAQELSSNDYCRIFVSDVLERIANYDIEHKTDYYDTLYYYVKRQRDLAQAAEALSIHRTSVSYRVKKIEEICGIQLDDDLVYFHLLVSLAIINLRPELFNAAIVKHSLLLLR